MDPFVFAIVLGAAALHAGWNAVIKQGSDRNATMLMMALMQAALALPLLPFVPAPAVESWGWLAASGLLHMGYKLFLTAAYNNGDLSQTYPIARGMAPLIVTVFSVAVLGTVLVSAQFLAVLCICAGVLILGFAGGQQVRLRGRGLIYALITACFTASYTLVDGTGARVAGTSAGFVLWMVVIDAIGMAAYAAATRGWSAWRPLRHNLGPGLAAGAMSLGSYWIAVWAFTQAPIALVAALRETSILFALLIAALLSREAVSPLRWGAAGLILLGLVLIRG